VLGDRGPADVHAGRNVTDGSGSGTQALEDDPSGPIAERIEHAICVSHD
jgi:hypothetical protein